MDTIWHIAPREMSHAQAKIGTHEDKPPLGTSGNNGNNMPLRYPIIVSIGYASPPKHSQYHHENENDKITSKDLMCFQQEELKQEIMLRVLEKNGNQYFQYLTSSGWKLPPNFDVQ